MDSMGRKAYLWLSVTIGVVVLCSAFAGCSGGAIARDDEAEKILSPAETKRLLGQLPYQFRFHKVPLPDGATGAVAARVHGPHGTWFDFGIALGEHADPVPVPHTGVDNAVANGTFIYTDNLVVRLHDSVFTTAKQIRTPAQYRESMRMATATEEKLCLAATGRPCVV